MAKAPGFLLIGPESIQGDNVQNAHVFDGFYDRETRKWKYQLSSRCSQVNAKNNAGYLIGETDEKVFCHKVIDGHAQTLNVCGICMATFFSGDDQT